jgi:hypothetical protein
MKSIGLQNGFNHLKPMCEPKTVFNEDKKEFRFCLEFIFPFHNSIS